MAESTVTDSGAAGKGAGKASGMVLSVRTPGTAADAAGKHPR
jgi:hypothetical protein